MTPILVCESVQARSLEDLRRARDASTVADLVELRLDGMRDLQVAGALEGRSTPVVVTCRPVWEGGAYDGDEETRRALLEQALLAGADFVDVEWAAPWRAEFLARWRHQVVLSFHDFSGTPVDLPDRVRAMLAEGAAVTKVAVMTTRLRDLGQLIALRREATSNRRVVLIGMGAAGVASRVLPYRFGSCWTYAGHGVAPGQIPAARLVHQYRVRSGSAATAVFGVVGRPVAHSLSPAIHNAAFVTRGIDAVYVPLHAEDLDDFAWAADTLGVVGASVTAPFKEEACRRARRVDAVASRVGAANTLRREADGGWAARNTDVEGFLAPLEGSPLEGARVAVLGAGGAAAATVAALTGQGAGVTLYARRADAARALAQRLGAQAAPWPPATGSWDLLVNATPVGTWPDVEASPLEASILHEGIVYDLVYNPAETALLQAARANGCRTIGGLSMLVAQAVRQFEWWTAQSAPTDVMRTAAERQLEEFVAQASGM